MTPCFHLDPDLYQVMDTIRNALETGDGGGIYMIVLDQVTALFKDQLNNTNSAGVSLPIWLWCVALIEGCNIGIIEIDRDTLFPS